MCATVHAAVLQSTLVLQLCHSARVHTHTHTHTHRVHTQAHTNTLFLYSHFGCNGGGLCVCLLALLQSTISIPMTLASAISMLSAHPKLDDRGSEILAAAISLQESTGRSLKEALHAMCIAWGVQRQEKISGKWKNRSVATLQELLTNAVCSAAAQYFAASPDNTTPEQRGAAEHGPSVSSGTGAAEHVAPDVLSACTKNTSPEHRGAAEHASPVSSGAGAAEHVAPDVLSASTGRSSPAESAEASNATQGPAKKAKTVPVSWAQLEHRAVALPETAEDVMELRRLGLDCFEATKRSGESWIGDAEALKTLPQGIAKLATLEVQELMRA